MKTFFATLLALALVCVSALALRPPAKGQCQIEIKAVVQDDQAQVWCVKVTTVEPAQFRIAAQGNHGGWSLGSHTVPTQGKGSLCEGEVWIVTSLIFPSNEDGGYLQTIASAKGGKCSQMREVNHGFKMTHQTNPALAGKSHSQDTALELGTLVDLKLAIMVGEKSQEFRFEPNTPKKPAAQSK